MNKTEELRKIKYEVLDLKESPLCVERLKNGTFPVIGAGNHDADLMFVGEAPGRNEVLTGRPFCGASGKIFDELLLHVGLKREDIYITNIVKDRPTANRDPLPAEIEAYGPFLDRQINIIQPKVIGALGRFSATYVMKKFGLESQIEGITKMHGKVFVAQSDYGEVRIVPLFHPAVALYNSSSMNGLKEDFLMLSQITKN